MTVRAAVNYPGVVSITIFNAGPADLRSDDFAGEAPAAGAAGDGERGRAPRVLEADTGT